MQQNLKEEIIKLKSNILRARFNLMFMIILSIINIVTLSSSSNILMPFSSSISTYATAFGIQISNQHGNNTFFILGLIIAFIILSVLLVCYFKSKNNVLFLVVSLGIIFIDTLALLIITIASGSYGNANVFCDFIIHIISLVYLIIAIKAFTQLGVINKLPYETVIENTEDDSEDEIITIDGQEEELTSPIGKYIDDGTEPLVSGEYEDLEVFTVIRNGKAELVINGYVCDVLNVTYMSEFELRAIVNNIDFNFQYKRDYNGETMYLYAENELLDSLGRNIY